MKTFELSPDEIDVIRHSVSLLKKDLNFDLVTFSKLGNLDAVKDCVDSLSSCEFILNKIKF